MHCQVSKIDSCKQMQPQCIQQTDWITVTAAVTVCDALLQLSSSTLAAHLRLCSFSKQFLSTLYCCKPAGRKQDRSSAPLQLDVLLCIEPLSARENDCPASTLHNHAIARSVNRRQAEAAERGVDNGAPKVTRQTASLRNELL